MKKENNLDENKSQLLSLEDDQQNQQKIDKNGFFHDNKIAAANLFTSRINVIAPAELKPPKTKSISCRQVLWYLAFIGFAVNYMIRINLNIAIVDMIKIKKITNNDNVIVSECYNQTAIIDFNQFSNISLMSVDGKNNNHTESIRVSSGRFSFEREILKFFKVSIICTTLY